MKRFLGLVGLLVLAFALPGSAKADDVLRIVAGTSLIEDVVRDLAGEETEIVVLIPGSSCPGHNDIKARDVVFAANADAIVLHAFQTHLPPVRSMLEKAAKPTVQKAIIDVEGNWVAPPVQREATLWIGEVLKKACPTRSAAITRRTERRLARLVDAETQAKTTLAPVQGYPVLASRMQVDFLAWAGIHVVESFGRVESMTPHDMAILARQGKEKGISGVIDNLQSGADAGRPIAEELNVPHVVLSNFPKSGTGTDDYFGLLSYNVNALSVLARR